jgi:hypothetical protein
VSARHQTPVSSDVPDILGILWLSLVSRACAGTRRDIPISMHHLPVPQPMSSTLLGRLRGANQLRWLNRALKMACCMSSRTFSGCGVEHQLGSCRAQRHGRRIPRRWGMGRLWHWSGLEVIREQRPGGMLTASHVTVVGPTMLLDIVPDARRQARRFPGRCELLRQAGEEAARNS